MESYTLTIPETAHREEVETTMAVCINHPEMQERVGSCETDIENVKASLARMELDIAAINRKLDGRYPAAIIWVLTILASFCSVLATIVLGNYLKP